MAPDDPIGVEEVAACLFCKTEGEQLYGPLQDRWFGVPGVWGFMRCPRCGFIWLNPRPLLEELSKVYISYFTHQLKQSRLHVFREKMGGAICSAVPGYHDLACGNGWALLGKILSFLPSVRELDSLEAMCLNGVQKGNLLDVGCGNGSFLARMRDAGWKVLGLEWDPSAAKAAQEWFGVPVIVGTLATAGLPARSIDAIILSHVIEHVHDPVGLLSQCSHILKSDGRLVMVTPNAESLGYRRFGQSWILLDPPRHLQIFSLATLRACAESSGLRIRVLRTSTRNAWWVWAVSRLIREQGLFSDSGMTWRLRLRGLVFQMREELLRATSGNAGEELVLVGSPET